MLDLIIITPTIGRKTLENTVNSIKNIKINNWKSIIIFDGIKKNFDPKDNRFVILETKKMGKENNAGLVRNIAFDFLLKKNIKSKFVCFVDDDDTLNPDYINNLNEEIKHNKDAELIVFRMIYTKNDRHHILPDERCTKILKCRVGISFCMKYDLMKYKFNNNQYEDFFFLKNIESKKHKIVFSSFINYFVRTDYNKCKKYIKNYPRVRINF